MFRRFRNQPCREKVFFCIVVFDFAEFVSQLGESPEVLAVSIQEKFCFWRVK